MDGQFTVAEILSIWGMGMTKPTAGPWEVKHSQSKDAWNIVGTIPGHLYKIARLPYQQDKRMPVNWNEAQKAEQLANANLMARAPAMLELIQEMYEFGIPLRCTGHQGIAVFVKAYDLLKEQGIYGEPSE